MATMFLFDINLELNRQTGVTYTLAEGDKNTIIVFSSTDPVTLNLPNHLPVGFSCVLAQEGEGQVTIALESGAQLRSLQGNTRTAGQYGMCSLIVLKNTTGLTAEYWFNGETTL